MSAAFGTFDIRDLAICIVSFANWHQQLYTMNLSQTNKIHRGEAVFSP